MEFIVNLVPIGNTTEKEIAASRIEVQAAVERLRGVERVTLVQGKAPEGAKGVATDFAAFLVSLPPSVISGLFETIRSVLTRPAQPPAKVKITADGVDLEFDPRRISLGDMAQFVKQLRPAT
jgi:hypothetical protein